MSTFRFITGAAQDNTGRVATFHQDSVAYGSTIALKPTDYSTLAKVAQLTGAATVTAATTQSNIGDELKLLLSSDGTNRVVTFGTGFSSSGTLTVTASKKATATFIFDGSTWVEVSRIVTA
jgi:hypothetical protein